MGKLKLTPQQQAVVENRGGSLLVSAAAGSGKTKVLVERLFRYVTEERCHVDDFLIITYTKAAAAELRGKIAAELSVRLGESPADAHLRHQLLRVYQADIKTVDAFCTALLRENTHLLASEGERDGLTPDFRVLDESEAGLVRRRVLPVGIMFSEYYFYLTAFLEDKTEFDNPDDMFPTIYRIDRIRDFKVLETHFKVPYKDRFQEGEFRKRVQFMYGGKLEKICFRYTGPSIEAVLDRLPTAEIISQDEDGWIVTAEVFGKGIEMWLRSQGDFVLMQNLAERRKKE